MVWVEPVHFVWKEDETVHLRERITVESAFQTKFVKERGRDNQPLTGNKPTIGNLRESTGNKV